MPLLELITGLGLSTATGLNAFIPLLSIGLLARFTDLVELPAGWAWLSNEWVLVIVGVLLVLEIVADKIPALDHVNDWVQTVVRPTAGGIVFGAGSASQTAAVTDPASFFASNAWVPIVLGVVISLLVHFAKMGTRAVANTVTAGAAAPVLSTGEDAMSVGLVFSAVLIPFFVIVLIAAMAFGAWWLLRSAAKRREARRAAAAAGAGETGTPSPASA